MKELRPKNKEFVREYIKNGNNSTKAVKEVFKMKDDNHAAVKGSILLRNTKVQKAIKSIAEQIPDSLLVEKHLELLNVPKIITTTKRGEYIDSEESTDVQAIKAGLDMAYKLKGNYAPEKQETIVRIERLEDIQKDTRKILEAKNI